MQPRDIFPAHAGGPAEGRGFLSCGDRTDLFRLRVCATCGRRWSNGATASPHPSSRRWCHFYMSASAAIASSPTYPFPRLLDCKYDPVRTTLRAPRLGGVGAPPRLHVPGRRPSLVQPATTASPHFAHQMPWHHRSAGVYLAIRCRPPISPLRATNPDTLRQRKYGTTTLGPIWPCPIVLRARNAALRAMQQNDRRRW